MVFNRLLRPVAVIMVALCFTEIVAINQQQWQFPKQLMRDNHLLIGDIENLPQHRGKTVRFGFKVSSLNNIQVPGNTKLNFRLSCYRHCPEFKADQKWQLLVRIKPANGYLNPRGFDYEKWLYLHQYKATGYIVQSSKNKLIATNTGINSLREKIKSYYIEKQVNSNSTGSAIALSVGDKSNLQNTQQQLLAKSGLSHLLAISGLHIGLSAIPGFLFAGFIWCRVSYFQKFCKIRFQWLVSIIPAIFYTALSGFGLPACRAMVMLLVFVILQLFSNSSSTYSRFGLALWIILVFQPLAPLDTSFWLSFYATGILILLSNLSQPKGSVKSLIQLQSQLFIMLLPIQLLIFPGVSLLSPVLNFFAIPFVSLILLPLIIIQVCFILLSLPGAEVILWIILQLLDLFWIALKAMESFSNAFFYTGPSDVFWSLMMFPLLFMLLLKFQLKVKFVIILLLSLMQTDKRTDASFRMLVLDVGQGLAISVDHLNKLLIYDSAYGNADFSTADMTILPWIEYLSIPAIDLLFIGHNDADHAGGLQTLLQKWPVNNLIVGPDVVVPEVIGPEGNLISSVPSNLCFQGQNWQWQELSIKVLSPMYENKLKDGNNSSCIVLLEIYGKNVLLTGDIELEAEQLLLKNHPDLTADILLVPHHGSKTSSGLPFIRQLKATYAIISSGYKNRFNHPDEKVMKRYEKAGVNTMNTAYSGAVEITIVPDGKIKIHQWRKEKASLWRRL